MIQALYKPIYGHRMDCKIFKFIIFYKHLFNAFD